VRAISLHQPHAAFIQYGLKPFETRSWATDYRGPLLIHAAKRLMTDRDSQFAAQIFYEISETEAWWEDFPIFHGGFVCVVDVTDCFMGHLVVEAPEGRAYSNLLGNFNRGSFAWQLDEVKRFQTPVPARGRQRFWNHEINLNEHELIPEPWRAL
jgi:hypothetical protein